MNKTDRFIWGVIYLNFPLWIAVMILISGFDRWDIARWMVYGNIVLLLSCFFLSSRNMTRRFREREDFTPGGRDG